MLAPPLPCRRRWHLLRGVCTCCLALADTNIRGRHSSCKCVERLCAECDANTIRADTCAFHQPWRDRIEDVVCSDAETRFYHFDPLLRRALYRYVIPSAPDPAILHEPLALFIVRHGGEREHANESAWSFHESMTALSRDVEVIRKISLTCFFYECHYGSARCLWHKDEP